MAAPVKKHDRESAKKKFSDLKITPLDDENAEDLFVDAPADLDKDDSGDSEQEDSASDFSDLVEDAEDSEDDEIMFDESDKSEDEDKKSSTSSSENNDNDVSQQINLKSKIKNGTSAKKKNVLTKIKTSHKNSPKLLDNADQLKIQISEQKELKTRRKMKSTKAPTKVSRNEKDKLNNERMASESVNTKDESVITNTNVYPDEYDFDSSDEEDIRNTVGNIPMEWYREYGHVGYDWEGRKIAAIKKGDQLDNFLNKMENPDYWRTVEDKSTGQSVLLSEQDLETIGRIKSGGYPGASTDPYEPWLDFFTHEKMIHPISNRPEHKRSFVPSHLERLKVGRMVHAIKMGWMKMPEEKEKDTDDEEDDEQPVYYQMWEDQEDENKRFRHHIAAPKLILPGHAESYNPPPEYIMTDKEKETWENQEPEKRRIGFIPKSFSSLRLVPAYRDFIKERFERCLDLYLCPRQRKMRANVDLEDLIPKLPKPRDLRPFPTQQALVYKGHTNLVRTISLDPTGQWFVSGSDDASVRLWEVSSGRCMNTLHLPGTVKSVAWNPNPAVSVVAVAVNNLVFIIVPNLGDKMVVTATDAMLSSGREPEAEVAAGDDENGDVNKIKWQNIDGALQKSGFRIKIQLSMPISQVTWHEKGDYFATVTPDVASMSVVIHQLTKHRSQTPFKKSKGLVQNVQFHPTRPFMYIATQRFVRVYNLVKQELIKKLITNCKWVSSMAIHPRGDNLIIGSYDCRMSWFDLDLSTKPYQTLKHHKKAIRQVAYHRKYPLFCSGSDDGKIIVCHGRVFDDLIQNPLIVPVKVLHGHTVEKDLGVLDVKFHPTQPWLLSSGADHTIRLFT